MQSLKNVLLLTLPSLVVLILVLEFLFSTIIPASDPPLGYFDEEVSMFRFDTAAKEKGLATIGPLGQQRGKWRVNNHGWLSPVDYFEKKKMPRIAVIGDSYIEALSVNIDESYMAILRGEIGNDFEIYSFGVSGAPLSQYLHMSRYAGKLFDPDILIFNVVHNDFAESLYAHNPRGVHWLRLLVEDGGIQEVPPRPNKTFSQYDPIKKLLRNSALVRYFVLNLRVKESLANLFAKETTYSANIDIRDLDENAKEIELAMDFIFERIKGEHVNRRIIFVMDADRESVYQNVHPEKGITFLHTLMEKLCLKFGFEFLDLSVPMREEYRQTMKKYNSEIDGHWDAYGHEFVSRQILGLLRTTHP